MRGAATFQDDSGTAPRRLRVFVCYARKDLALARGLIAGLEQHGLQALIDERDLPYAEKWRDELDRMIRNADAVVFMASRAAVASEWCSWELSRVAQYAKRLVPILIEDILPRDLPPAVQELQLLRCMGSDGLTSLWPVLVPCLTIERRWILLHTQLTERASQWLREASADQLLRGAELERAQQWQQNRPAAAPAAGSEVLSFVAASAQAARRRSRRLLTIVSAGAVGALLLAVTAWLQRDQAIAQRNAAESARWSAQAQLLRHEDPDRAVPALLRSWSFLPTRQNLGQIYGALAERDRLLATLRGHDASVAAVTLYPEKRLIVSGGDDGYARVWDLDKLSLRLAVRGSLRPLLNAHLSPDGRWLAAMDEAGFVSLWDAASGKLRENLANGDSAMPAEQRERRVPRLEARAASMEFSDDSKRFATWSTQGVWLYDLAHGKLVSKIAVQAADQPLGHDASPSFSPDGRLLAVASRWGVQLFRAVDGQWLATPVQARDCSCQASFSATGNWLLLRAPVDSGRVGDGAAGSAPVAHSALQVVDERLVALAGPAGARLLWLDAAAEHAYWLAADRLSLWRSALPAATPPAAGASAPGVAPDAPTLVQSFDTPIAGSSVISREKAQVALLMGGGRAWLWRTSVPNPTLLDLELPAAEADAASLASPELVVWHDADGLQHPAWFRGKHVSQPADEPTQAHEPVSESQDVFRRSRLPMLPPSEQGTLALRRAKGDLALMDLASATSIATLVGATGSVRAWTIDAQKQRLVTAHDDGTLRLWDMRRDRNEAEFILHGGVSGSGSANASEPKESSKEDRELGHSPKRRFIVTSSGLGQAQVVEVATGRVLSTLYSPDDESPHEAAAVSEDGRRVATLDEVFWKSKDDYNVSEKPFIRIWDSSGPQAVVRHRLGALPDPKLTGYQRIRLAEDGDWALRFDASGTRLVSYREGGKFRQPLTLWRADTGQRLLEVSALHIDREIAWLRVNEVAGLLEFGESAPDIPFNWRYRAFALSDGRESPLSDRPNGPFTERTNADSDHLLRREGEAWFVQRHGTQAARVALRTGIKRVSASAFGGQGQQVVLGGEDGEISVYRSSDGALLWQHAAGRPLRSLAFSPQAQTLVATTDQTTLLLDLHDRRRIAKLPYRLAVLSIGADERLMLATAGRGSLGLFSTDSGEQLPIDLPQGLDDLASASLRDDGRIDLVMRDGHAVHWRCSLCLSDRTAASELARRSGLPLSGTHLDSAPTEPKAPSAPLGVR